MYRVILIGMITILGIALSSFLTNLGSKGNNGVEDTKAMSSLLEKMTLQEKLGQLNQRNGADGWSLKIKNGEIGSILNVNDPTAINKLQKIAVEESRLKIPLLFARDVIHGYKTILPIPLGLAATWNTELVQQGARMSAVEAASQGIKWTFSPMIDVTRDHRWGRIAESFGEDPYLCSQMGLAMIEGYQGEDLSNKSAIAACAKHFAAYGWGEGGRDYNTVNIPRTDLYDMVLPPFKVAADNGVATFMTAFNDINGIPASGHQELVKDVLKHDWEYEGMVVSDWESVRQMSVHGYSENDKQSAEYALKAGVDMEMASTTYKDHLKELLEQGAVTIEMIDDAVLRILELKASLGLFDDPYVDPSEFPSLVNDEHRKLAEAAAVESFVLLKNDNSILPLHNNLKSMAVIGPLADAPHDQLGTWIFDGDKKHSVTPLESLKEYYGAKATINYAKGLEISRTRSNQGFDEALEAASRSEIVICFLGEESILSGESHSRADIDLPGAQLELVKEFKKQGKPMIAVIMAGRPLTIENILDEFDAILYAWHPGTMAGPALVKVLSGEVSPSGKLPVSMLRHVGQLPMYYNHKNTGKPATEQSYEHMDDIQAEAPQLSIGNTSHYLDYGYKPLYPFGYGLTYSKFSYKDIELVSDQIPLDGTIEASITLRNEGEYDAKEVVQLYVKDHYGSRTRPVKELKAFEKVSLKAGESSKVNFKLPVSSLAFYTANEKMEVEPGAFTLMIGGDSDNVQSVPFHVIVDKDDKTRR